MGAIPGLCFRWEQNEGEGWVGCGYGEWRGDIENER